MKSTFISLVLVGTVFASQNTWRATGGDVRVTCPMTVGGSFDARTSGLTGSVAASASGQSLDGSIAVDLRTLDTGIGLRNEHLRERYLEVAKGPDFDTATLSQIDLNGIDPGAPQGNGSFTGMLTLHGVKRKVTGAVDVRPAGTGLRIRASFPVALPDFNISKPRYLGIGVKDVVRVEVTFTVAH
jgi:polyisoprenoid-binding protein YceI